MGTCRRQRGCAHTDGEGHADQRPAERHAVHGAALPRVPAGNDEPSLQHGLAPARAAVSTPCPDATQHAAALNRSRQPATPDQGWEPDGSISTHSRACYSATPLHLLTDGGAAQRSLRYAYQASTCLSWSGGWGGAARRGGARLVAVHDLLRQARGGAHGHVAPELHLVLVQVQLHVRGQVLRIGRGARATHVHLPARRARACWWVARGWCQLRYRALCQAPDAIAWQPSMRAQFRAEGRRLQGSA